MVIKVKDFIRSLSSEEVFVLNGILTPMQCYIDTNSKHLSNCSRREYSRIKDIPTYILDSTEYQELLSFARESHIDDHSFWKNCQVELKRVIETYAHILGAEIVHDLSPLAHSDSYREHTHSAIANLFNEAREKIPV
jgi:hypothetical protein